MASLMVEVKGPFDSKKLWGLIEKYGVNLTDLGDKVLVYGDLDVKESTVVISCCSMFGEIKAEYGGG